MTILSTARLILRPKQVDDAKAMHEMVSEWEVVCWTASWPWPPERSFTEERLEGGQPDQGLIATILHDGAVIGMASVLRAELGYMLAPSAWGQGCATEACTAHFGFGMTDWPVIDAGVFVGNDASVRVLRKLGFQEVRRVRAMCRAEGREIDGVDFALAREDWTAQIGRHIGHGI